MRGNICNQKLLCVKICRVTSGAGDVEVSDCSTTGSAAPLSQTDF